MIRCWLRLEVRRRLRSLVGLALLVALSTAVVAASFAGARRGASALDRLIARSSTATVVALPNQPGFDWDKVRALPQVASVGEFAVAHFGADAALLVNSSFPAIGTEWFHSIERPTVLQGRLADPARVDEVMVTRRFPAWFGKGVGDTVTLSLPSAAQTADPGFSPTTAADLAGPRISARIVGVIVAPWMSDPIGQDPQIITTPALAGRYRPELVGPNGFVNALIRLKNGEADIPAFRDGLAAVSHRGDIEVWSEELKEFVPMRRMTGFEAASLAAFGAAGLAAALVLVGQSVARTTAAAVADLRVLTAVGMTRREAVRAATAAPLGAALAGSTLGVAAAVAVSRWLPIGAAASFEPSPGLSADATVLAAAWVLAPLLVGLAAAGSAVFFLRPRPGRARRSWIAVAASRAGAPVPVLIGLRFALEPGRGRTSVPVRPALTGAIVGVLGIVAALTFSAGVRDGAAHPARFGQVDQLEAFPGTDGRDGGPVPEVIAAVVADRDVAALDDARVGIAQAGSTSISTYTYSSKGSQPFPVPLLAGRLPAAADEITLSPGMARAAGTGIGGTVTLVGGGTPTPMRVTGIAFAPIGPHNDYDEGGWITPGGHDALYAGAPYAFKFHELLVRLRPGADPATVAARLREASTGLDYGPPFPINQIPVLKDVRQLPLLLAGFLAVLATGAIAHALATAVRRRGQEVAVLRALGMTRRQARTTVVTQAMALALIGLAVGIPSGLAVGRGLWRFVADLTPMIYLPPGVAASVLLTAVALLVTTGLIAALPSRAVARRRVGSTLRVE